MAAGKGNALSCRTREKRSIVIWKNDKFAAGRLLPDQRGRRKYQRLFRILNAFILTIYARCQNTGLAARLFVVKIKKGDDA